MKQFLILLTASVLFFSVHTAAQQTEDSIIATIQQLFTGLRTANAALVKEAFADSAILQTIRRRPDGSSYVQLESVKEFCETVGRLKKDSADERIRFESVKIDGPLASVWTPYQFYYAGTFSHCGVNSFQLVRINNRWKIQYLIDTRRKQGCQ